MRSPSAGTEMNPRLYPMKQMEFLTRDPKQIVIPKLDFIAFLILAFCQPPDHITYRFIKSVALEEIPRCKRIPTEAGLSLLNRRISRVPHQKEGLANGL